MQDWSEYAEIVTALFVIVDPLVAIPLFVSLTGGYSEMERRYTSRVTAFTVAAVLVGAVFLGELLTAAFIK